MKAKEQFVKYRRTMLESPAYRRLSPLAKTVLHALELEHLRRGGHSNGDLALGYAAMRRYCRGAGRNRIAQALRELEALGFVVIERGGLAGNRMSPNRYRITHLPDRDGGAATDEWSAIDTDEEAARRLEAIAPAKQRPPGLNGHLAHMRDRL